VIGFVLWGGGGNACCALMVVVACCVFERVRISCAVSASQRPVEVFFFLLRLDEVFVLHVCIWRVTAPCTRCMRLGGRSVGWRPRVFLVEHVNAGGTTAHVCVVCCLLLVCVVFCVRGCVGVGAVSIVVLPLKTAFLRVCHPIGTGREAREAARARHFTCVPCQLTHHTHRQRWWCCCAPWFVYGGV